MWWRRTKAPDVPIRDGLTHGMDVKRTLDLLACTPALGGLRANESYSHYVTRVLASHNELAKRLGVAPKGGDDTTFIDGKPF